MKLSDISPQPKMKLSQVTQPRTKLSQIQAQQDKVEAPDLAPPSPMLSGIPEHIRMPLETVFRREEALPGIGQAVGGIFGDKVPIKGAGLAGAVGGQTVGEVGRQAVNVLKGEAKGFDLGKIGGDAAKTALVEGVTRGALGHVFRRQNTNKTLGELSKRLKGMKDALSKNSKLGVDSMQVYVPLKEATEGVAVPHGQQSSIISKWLRFMEKNPKLTAKNLIELESDLGEVAKFGEFEKGAFIPATGVKKPALNTIAREGRTNVSNIVDKLAEESGQKGFGKVSKQISKILKRPESYDVTKTGGNELSRIATALGIGSFSKLGGLLSYGAMKLAQSPTVRNKLFQAGGTGLGKATGAGTKATLAELLRKASRE